MKLNKNNLHITQHAGKFIICIIMPDNSRNYLHCEPITLLSEAILIKADFDGDLELNNENTSLTIEDSYYRIIIFLEDGRGHEHRFHSRKLNVNDAVNEFEMLVY